eukprot:753840-Hanusia_phi.AAC.1
MLQRLYKAFHSLKARRGVVFFLWISVFIFLCAFLVIIIAQALPRCLNSSMPCVLDQSGGCLCSVRSYDGSCWLKTASLMKCYSTTIVVPSGTCQGSYTTRLCGESQLEISSLTSEITRAYNQLQANKTDMCYTSYSNENSRCRYRNSSISCNSRFHDKICRLPYAQYKPRPFVAEECCRPPVQTCASDLDCCDCGYESSQCTAPLKCIVTKSTSSAITEESTSCQSDQDGKLAAFASMLTGRLQPASALYSLAVLGTPAPAPPTHLTSRL